jgi:endonuclease I
MNDVLTFGNVCKLKKSLFIEFSYPAVVLFRLNSLCLHINLYQKLVYLFMKKFLPFQKFVVSAFFSLIFCISTALAAIPPGYYNTATGTGATLKTNLYNIINGHTSKGYDLLWTAFETTDKRADGKVWDMYSNTNYDFSTNQCGSTISGEGDCYNREHSFPASWFGGEVSPMYTDLFQVYPSDGKVNEVRGNYPYGKVGTADYTSTNGSKRGNCVTTGYSGTVFEPADEYKGDFARTYFYMATRYENLIAGWYANSTYADAVLQNNNFPVFETWFLNMLGEWHVADPVSQKEIDRNDAIYAIQGNRNPFIDHPEYVYQIWGVGQTNTAKIEAGIQRPNGSTLDFGTVSATATKTLQVKTADITGDLTVTVTGAMFSTSTATISLMQANTGYEISVSYTPTSSGTHTGTLTISGGGLNPAYSVSLSGKR